MNPFKKMDTLYSPAKMAEYSETDPSSAPPHIYAIGEAAYQGIHVKHTRVPRNQAIIVSGDSGAGKTVSNKLLMQYYASRSGSTDAAAMTETITNLMHDSNPILEVEKAPLPDEAARLSLYWRWKRQPSQSRQPTPSFSAGVW